MSTAEVILIAVVGVLGLLALGGYLGNRRRARQGEEHFRRQLEAANRDLAAAHAADNGWQPERLYDAVRGAFNAERHEDVRSVELIQVVDPPGTEDDKAVFFVSSASGTHRVVMGRSGDDWLLESVG